MSKKIYIGNLNYDSEETSLADMFSEYGEVLSTKIIVDKFSGKSKGFAFVEMADDDAAFAAISGINGKELDGRQLKVNKAFDKPKRNNFKRGNDRFYWYSSLTHILKTQYCFNFLK